MIKFKGDIYTVDINAIVDYTKLSKKTNFEDVITRINKSKELDEEVEPIDTEEYPTNEVLNETPMLDVTKWDIVRGLLDTVLSLGDIIDNKIPLEQQVPFPFILSFNTLIKNKFIIKK